MNGSYLVARVLSAAPTPIPNGQRLPRGWQAFAVPHAGSSQGVVLQWSDQAAPASIQRALFRVTVALDEREEKLLGVFLPGGDQLGVLDIRYAHLFQPFELTLPPEAVSAMLQHGCELRLLKGKQPLWLFHDPSGKHACDAFMPHLLADSPNADLNSLLRQLNSLASLQFFGWQEGCVLDGLLDLHTTCPESGYAATARAHLAQFFDPDGSLVAEDDYSLPADGRIYGIEATLPYAALSRLEPSHPVLEQVTEFWRSARDETGAVMDDQASYLHPVEGKMLTTEGCYTLAYPMAALSHLPGRSWLAGLAADQLLVRQRLFDGQALASRRHEDGSTAFVNWSRGSAWYLLGTARTLSALHKFERPLELITGFQRAAEWIQRWQLEGGLWPVFLHQPDLLPDSAGSAGLAAALAIGHQSGWLDSNAHQSALRALHALQQQLTPDGFLRGVSQVNKAGEALQRGTYRVISQMAMGLTAQLAAALRQGSPCG